VIFGIGADLVEIPRVAKLLERYGDRFAQRVLGDSEWGAYRSSAHPERYLASRFAAKEAFGKAVGTGVRAPVLLTHISVVNDQAGKPVFQLSEPVQALLVRNGVTAHHLTLTHERGMAAAVVVLES
jgi:holo-[acyl-carrier protein] synthase